jgi:biopolymer transport protein ExbD
MAMEKLLSGKCGAILYTEEKGKLSRKSDRKMEEINIIPGIDITWIRASELTFYLLLNVLVTVLQWSVNTLHATAHCHRKLQERTTENLREMTSVILSITAKDSSPTSSTTTTGVSTNPLLIQSQQNCTTRSRHTQIHSRV